MRLRLVLCSVVAAGLVWGAVPVHARSAKKLTPEQTLLWEAARALYGHGLVIKRNRRATTIAPKRGGLTQAKYNQYVDKAYLPALKHYLTRLHGQPFRWAKDYKAKQFATRGAVKRAHILLEPLLKYRLCRQIVSNMRVGFGAWERIAWCALQGMREAIAPIYEYRGAKVTWKARQDKGNLKITDTIFQKDASGNYPIVVTVRGGSNIYTQVSTKLLFKLSEDIDADLAKKHRRKADKMYKVALRKYRRLMKIVARKQRRWAGRNKVIFSDQRFYASVARKPAKGPIACDSVYYLAYAPRRARRQGYYLAVNINKVECSGLPLSAKSVDRNDLIGCDRLFKPGQNKVAVNVHYSLDDFKYKRKEWQRRGNRYRLKNRTYIKTKKGKKLYGNSITCTKN